MKDQWAWSVFHSISHNTKTFNNMWIWYNNIQLKMYLHQHWNDPTWKLWLEVSHQQWNGISQNFLCTTSLPTLCLWNWKLWWIDFLVRTWKTYQKGTLKTFNTNVYLLISMSQLQLKDVVSPLSTMLGTLTRRLLSELGPSKCDVYFKN